MKIKQAEELVGITSKNIRFYEEQGLLQPNRSDNGYRNYTSEDIETLKRIKYLRKFGTPLEEIKKLFQGNMSMKECLDNRDDALGKEQKNIEKMRMLIGQMHGQCQSIEKMNIDFWLDEMETMEKEGVDFVDSSRIDIHRKRKMGAIIGACAASLFIVMLLAIDIWGWFADPDYPIGIFLLLLAIAVALGIGILVALVSRLKEIEKGEEDEAAKY